MVFNIALLFLTIFHNLPLPHLILKALFSAVHFSFTLHRICRTVPIHLYNTLALAWPYPVSISPSSFSRSDVKRKKRSCQDRLRMDDLYVRVVHSSGFPCLRYASCSPATSSSSPTATNTVWSWHAITRELVLPSRTLFLLRPPHRADLLA